MLLLKNYLFYCFFFLNLLDCVILIRFFFFQTGFYFKQKSEGYVIKGIILDVVETWLTRQANNIFIFQWLNQLLNNICNTYFFCQYSIQFNSLKAVDVTLKIIISHFSLWSMWLCLMNGQEFIWQQSNPNFNLKVYYK